MNKLVTLIGELFDKIPKGIHLDDVSPKKERKE